MAFPYVLSPEDAHRVVKRLSGLGVEHIYSGIEDKWPVFQQFLSSFNLKANEICYMGDDLPDLQILQKVGSPLVRPMPYRKFGRDRLHFAARWRCRLCAGCVLEKC
ncbi:MAG: hypothetical protein IPM98_21035 [Lewinellaceae bacterium]|nr:hypothetical protein [Lewinellaceae bacterium]